MFKLIRSLLILCLPLTACDGCQNPPQGSNCISECYENCGTDNYYARTIDQYQCLKHCLAPCGGAPAPILLNPDGGTSGCHHPICFNQCCDAGYCMTECCEYCENS